MVKKEDIQKSIERSSTVNKISNIIQDNIIISDMTDDMDLLEKCGKGPSTGYVDGVQYKKDYQRVTDGRAKVGELEQKQLDFQVSQKNLHNPRDPDAPRWKDPRSSTEREMSKCMDFPEDMIGMGVHGDNFVTGNIEDMGDPENGISGAFGWDIGIDDVNAPYSELEGAYDTFAHEMDKAPPLQDNVMLFTHDIPNPNLQEGDVFELDTYLGVNFQKKMVGAYDDTFTDVDIPKVRSEGTDPDNVYGNTYSYYDGNPYEVTVLGSEGTPILMTDPYYDGVTHINVHEGILNKGQKVRLVRVNHEKRTAIYQTVDG